MYETIMFIIYLTGAVTMLIMNIWGEWDWRREFGEGQPSHIRLMGWSLFLCFLGAAGGWAAML